jgi:hypothetical protein
MRTSFVSDPAALYARFVANEVKVLIPYDGDGGEFLVQDPDNQVLRIFRLRHAHAGTGFGDRPSNWHCQRAHADPRFTSCDIRKASMHAFALSFGCLRLPRPIAQRSRLSTCI